MYEDDDECEKGRRWINVNKLDVGDAPLDTIDLYNLVIPFFRKRSKGWN